MENKTKSNEELITGVKAIIDEDASITIQAIVEALDISSGSVSNI